MINQRAIKMTCRVLFALSLIVIFPGISAKADFILSTYGTGTPIGSWAYSKQIGVGQGNSETYIPVKADYGKAVFQGYVQYDAQGVIVTRGSGVFGEDTIYVFRTYVTSTTDSTITILTGSDDGHATYINGVFEGGGGFAQLSTITLNLTAGVPVEIEQSNYNGPGSMESLVQRVDNGQRIDSVPGISISAVPEPSSLVLFGSGLMLLVFRVTRHLILVPGGRRDASPPAPRRP
jgi:hypothetical protein